MFFGTPVWPSRSKIAAGTAAQTLADAGVQILGFSNAKTVYTSKMTVGYYLLVVAQIFALRALGYASRTRRIQENKEFTTATDPKNSTTTVVVVSPTNVIPNTMGPYPTTGTIPINNYPSTNTNNETPVLPTSFYPNTRVV